MLAEEVIMTERIMDYIKQILFQIRWLTWSDRARYAYLWNRTQETAYGHPQYK